MLTMERFHSLPTAQQQKLTQAICWIGLVVLISLKVIKFPLSASYNVRDAMDATNRRLKLLKNSAFRLIYYMCGNLELNILGIY